MTTGVRKVIPIRLHAASAWGEPAVHGATVFFLSRGHEVLAVDRRRGHLVWRQPLGDGAALTGGDRVVVQGVNLVVGDERLYGFDRDTGRARWRFPPLREDGGIGVDDEDDEDDEGGGLGRYLGEASDGLVFAGSRTGRVHAIDMATGRLRWASEAVGLNVVVAAPIVDGGLVVAGYTDFGVTPRQGGVVAYEREGGALRWRTEFPPGTAASAFAGGPAVTGGLVVAAASDGAVHAVGRATGRVRWSFEGGMDEGVEYFRPVAASGSALLIGSTSGELVAIDRGTRRTLWRFRSPADGSLAFRLVVGGGSIYVPFASGRTIAIDVRTGRERWRVGGGSHRFEWPAAVAGRQVYLTSEDGLYVVNQPKE